MSRCLRLGATLLLTLLIPLRSPAVYAADPPEPPPAQVLDEEPAPAEREPEPGPLREDPDQIARIKQQQDRKAALDRSRRTYQAIGAVGATLTTALAISGITLGLLAQHRSDELSLLTVQRENGRAPLYDEAQRQQYEQLQQEGRTFQRATIACFVTVGVTALGSGLLFWQASRKESAIKKLALIPLPQLSTQQLALSLSGRF